MFFIYVLQWIQTLIYGLLINKKYVCLYFNLIFLGIFGLDNIYKENFYLSFAFNFEEEKKKHIGFYDNWCLLLLLEHNVIKKKHKIKSSIFINFFLNAGFCHFFLAKFHADAIQHTINPSIYISISFVLYTTMTLTCALN